jgi:hypothetical protein
VSDGREIIEFRIQLEILVSGEWYAVIRYDTAHGKPHRDILRPSDPTEIGHALLNILG